MGAPQKPYANITKSFVHLAAQICFMKNCWNPSPMTAITGPCTRHYHPTLSIWLSVDPMSDKYPSTSPYTYCANNPVRLVDPDGEDWWEVNQSGYFKHVEGSEGKPDKLFAVRGYNNKFRKITDATPSISVNASIMETIVSSSDEAQHMRVKIDEKRGDMIDLFNFLADNTNVEWALASVCWPTGWGMDKDIPSDFLITDHHQTEVKELNFTINFGENLECFRHNHPRYYSLETLLEPSLLNVVSDKDIDHMKACQKAGATCPFILHSNGKDRRYDQVTE